MYNQYSFYLANIELFPLSYKETKSIGIANIRMGTTRLKKQGMFLYFCKECWSYFSNDHRMCCKTIRELGRKCTRYCIEKSTTYGRDKRGATRANVRRGVSKGGAKRAIAFHPMDRFFYPYNYGYNTL